MKKFSFSLEPVLKQREYEKTQALQNLARVVTQVNALSVERSAVLSTMNAWEQEVRSDFLQQDAASSMSRRAEARAYAREMQGHVADMLLVLKEKEARLQKELSVEQANVRQKQQEAEKWATLKEREYAEWKKAMKKSEQLALYEQILLPANGKQKVRKSII